MSVDGSEEGEVVSSDAAVILPPRWPEDLHSAKYPTVFPIAFIDDRQPDCLDQILTEPTGEEAFCRVVCDKPACERGQEPS